MGSDLAIQTLNGISYGLLLFLLSAGLSIIFGFMGIINMAHGSFFMMGAYVGLTIIELTDNYILSIVGAAVIIALMGVLIERYFLRRVPQALSQVLLTFGFTYIIMDLAKFIWGGTPKGIAIPTFLEGSLTVMENVFPVYRIVLVSVGLGVALALWIIMEKTKVGMIIRAGVDDLSMVEALGINIRSYFSLVFALGAGLAAIGGVVGGPIIGAYPGLDFEILILALVIVVVGGMGSLKGAFWGSMLIGISETFSKSIFPNYSILTIYILMVLILLFKPAGLFGKESF